MDSIRSSEQHFAPLCMSEFGKLHDVILCSPLHMEIKHIINETQKHFAKDNISQIKAIAQHTQFVQALIDHKVQPILLPSIEHFPEQVFTRDIGFTIGRTVFISNMAASIRQGEEQLLKEWIKSKGWGYTELKDTSIEGGDVLIDQHRVYVGISSRTSRAALIQLKQALPQYEMIPLLLNPSILHLDCVFNIISGDEALIYSPAFLKEDLHMLSQQYNLIEVTEQEQFTLGTNVLSIGQKNIFTLPINKKVNKALSKRGYNVIEVDFSEIIKSGGSFRCCTMPISRT
ncbi:dimethylarginine dimethylaminohydrolase family protein [Bacillus sp. NPDC077027]|uniref:dimethylarginine dimethylaminohydrolase family protein n=1 Tax=Bacillus sp. NPDC077027 TaxID=3390548 RepID=UPI003D08BDAB